MRKVYATMLLSWLWCIFAIDESYALNAASESSAAVAGYLDKGPVQQSQVVTSFSQMFTDRLLHSEVLGDFAYFQVYQPYDIFYKSAVRLLSRAGIDDLDLAKFLADAVTEVGVVTSKLFFDAVGTTLAKFMFERGLLTIDNVEYVALSFVTSIELVACKRGLTGTLSVFNAFVFGFYNVWKSYSLVNYDNLAALIYIFSEEIKVLAGLHD